MIDVSHFVTNEIKVDREVHILSHSLLLGFKMSCMKKSVCTEPSVEIVDPKDEISSRCTVKVMQKRLGNAKTLV